MATAIPLSKSIVLIGLMGAGKSSVGRRLGKRLDLPFADADKEVVAAAGCSIDDIFELYGEPSFRELERRVIGRLLNGEQKILATGGGAFMDSEARVMIKSKGVSIWLRADLELLSRRTQGRGGRPLLANDNPSATLKKLMDKRYPVYAEADIIFDCKNETPAETTKRVVEAIAAYLTKGSI